MPTQYIPKRERPSIRCAMLFSPFPPNKKTRRQNLPAHLDSPTGQLSLVTPDRTARFRRPAHRASVPESSFEPVVSSRALYQQDAAGSLLNEPARKVLLSEETIGIICMTDESIAFAGKTSYLSHSITIIYGSPCLNSPIFLLPWHSIRNSACPQAQGRVYVLYTLPQKTRPLKQSIVCVSIQ